MEIIWTIIVGFFVGLLARLFMPGRDDLGLLMTTALGVLGALAGGWLGRLLGMYDPNEPAGIFMSIIGAMVLLFAYNKIRGGHRGPRVPAA